MAWSPEHEARIRGMIDTAVKAYIDTPVVIDPKLVIKNKNTYELTQAWTDY